MFCISYVVVTVKARLIGFDRQPRGGGDGPRRERVDDLPEGDAAADRARRSSPAALLSFALSVDDFVVTYFNSGTQVTFPLFVWGAAQRGVPPQVNVMGTAIFVVALSLMVVNVLLAAPPRKPA